MKKDIDFDKLYEQAKLEIMKIRGRDPEKEKLNAFLMPECSFFIFIHFY